MNIYSRNNLPQSIFLGRKIPQEFLSGIKIPDSLRNIIPGQEFRFLNFFADFCAKKVVNFYNFFSFFNVRRHKTLLIWFMYNFMNHYLYFTSLRSSRNISSRNSFPRNKIPGRNLPTGIFSGSFSPSRAKLPRFFFLAWQNKSRAFCASRETPSLWHL